MVQVQVAAVTIPDYSRVRWRRPSDPYGPETITDIMISDPDPPIADIASHLYRQDLSVRNDAAVMSLPFINP